MDGASVDADKTRWLILIYHLPREPSRHRVAVWRKLKTLGALYLQDGAAVLPENTITREQLEWLQVRVREAGGEATLWEALPNTIAEDGELVETFRAAREEAYAEIIEAAGRLRRKTALGADGAALLEELGKAEREFRTERRRDYFHAPLREKAAEELKSVRWTLTGKSREESAGTGSEGS